MAFGETLKQKRIERGWTKETVAERTHMMVRTIDALEAEHLKRIPAPIYGRGFIRQYCALLGIDPQPLVEDYTRAVDGDRRPLPVTRPAVSGLPERPPEPIHTGAHRTLPPKPQSANAQPAPTVRHKLVEPAEATFTAVPKPESMPIAGGSAPNAPEPLVLDGGTIAESPHGSRPAREPTPPTGRAALAERLEIPKRRRDMTPARDPRPAPRAGGSIFGPQHPVPDPPNPQVRSLLAAFTGLGRMVRDVVRQATRPKVRRMGGRPEPFFTRRLLSQALFVFLALLGLTLLGFAFRYVFRASAGAEREEAPTATAAPQRFEPRPVAPPPEPYFK